MGINKTSLIYWGQKILDECCTASVSDDSLGVSGQYFLGDGMNIIVSERNCFTADDTDDLRHAHGNGGLDERP